MSRETRLFLLVVTIALTVSACSKSKSKRHKPSAAPARQQSFTEETGEGGLYPSAPAPAPGAARTATRSYNEEAYNEEVIGTGDEVGGATGVPYASSVRAAPERPRRVGTAYPETAVEEGPSRSQGRARGEIPGPSFGEEPSPGRGGGNACGTAYRSSDSDWFPGLPYPPAERPNFTGGGETRGFQFTDARQDGMMNFARMRTEQMPAPVREASDRFAIRIRDVRVRAEIETGLAEVTFTYEATQGRLDQVRLAGQMASRSGRGRVEVALSEVSGGGPFTGVLSCADVDMGCLNTYVRIEMRGRSGKVARVAKCRASMGSGACERVGRGFVSVPFASQRRPRRGRRISIEYGE
ncbi:MAG: hypothetical protein HC902_10750 [Calothrix sp. SM1_5_4]|nr:hypothetical protein [Calothrix sp. SM1_5_4]